MPASNRLKKNKLVTSAVVELFNARGQDRAFCTAIKEEEEKPTKKRKKKSTNKKKNCEGDEEDIDAIAGLKSG